LSCGEIDLHPDVLIRELIADPERLATAEEVARILEYIARAPFNTRRIDVPPVLVGRKFFGRRLEAREDSLTVHLAQRVFVDEQWSDNTMKEEFLEDIEQAVLHPEARLAVYEARQTDYAAVAAPNTVPSERLGRAPGGCVIVFYSANRGRIISARQARDESKFNVPERARWLS